MTSQIPDPKSPNKNIFSKIKFTRKFLIGAFLVFGIVAIIAGITLLTQRDDRVAQAASCTWTGNNSGDFSDSGNWSACGGNAPQTGDDVTFPDSATTYALNNDISGLSLNTVTVEALNTSAYTLSGNLLDVTYGITTTSGNFDFIYNTDVTTCRTEGNGSITINSGITYTTGCSDFISYAFSGNINGSGTFVKNNFFDLELSSSVDAILVLDAGSTTVPYGGSLNTTNQVTINNGALLVILDGPSSFNNYPVTVNNGGFQHLTSGSIEVYGLNFTDSVNSKYHTWGNNTTIVSGSDLDLTNANYEMSFWGTSISEQTTVIQTTNGHVITGEFANWPSATTKFFPNGSNTVEASIQYNSDNIVITVVDIFSGDCTWTGDNSGDWSDAGNWDGCSGAAPVNGKNLIFPSAVVNYNMNNDISGLDLAKITIESLGNSDYTLSGNNIIVSGPVEFTGSGSSYRFFFNTNVTSQGVAGDGLFEIGSGYFFTVGNGANYTFTGIIDGQGEFKKTGSGIQTLNNVITGSSNNIVSEGAFLDLKGSTQIQGTLYNNSGSGILVGQSSNAIINTIEANGGNILFYPTGSGSPAQINSATINSGDISFDTNSTTDHGEVDFVNGVDVTNATIGMRFFNTFNINDTFTVITSQNGSIIGEFSNLPSSGSLMGQGWVNNTVVSDVEYTATYNNDSVVITITDIIPFTCTGSLVYTANTGTVTSGINNYNPNSNCSWVIAPANADSVTLDFTTFDTETSNDIVRIYDGLTTNSALLGEYSGNSLPSSITADSGAMLITFSSNGDTEAAGFSANWTSVEIPGPEIVSADPVSGDISGGTNVTLNGSNFETGQYQDIQSVGDTNYDGARGLVVDATGQYVAGEFSGSITLGSTTLTSSGGTDIYIAKIDSNADYVWAVKAGGSGTDGFDRRQSMYFNDYDGTLMMAGFYQSSADFGATTLSGGSGSNIFISKINKTTGDFIWAKSAGGDTAGVVYTGNSFPAQYGGSIDVDSSGNIYFSGKVDGSSPSFDAINVTLENSDSDMFVAKMDSSGNFIWVKNYGASQNPQNQQVHGLVVDSSDDVYATTGFAGTITIGATTLTSQGNTDVSNAAIFKLDSSGNEIWAVSGGVVGGLVGANDLPYDLDLDSSGNLYLTGYHGGATATFGSINLVGSAAGSTIYTSQMNPSNGDFVWVSQLYTPGGNNSFGTSRDMHIDSNDAIWIGGTYTDVLTDGNLSTTGIGANAFFAQYDTSGNLIQLEGIGGTGGQLLVGGVGGNQVRSVYEYGGKLYIAGEYFDTVGIGGQTITSAGNQDGFYTTWVIGKTSVKIDGIEVEADFISSSELSFTTPPNTKGFKDIIITNSDGRSYTLSGGYEYTAPFIQNSDITSLSCTPSTTEINTTVNCTITTNVDINTLSGTVNVRIGTGGTPSSCSVGASGTTITCNSVAVGGTEGVFPSQYNASGSGATYLDGNNITVTANSGNNGGCTAGGASGTPGQTVVDLCVDGGTLTLYAGDSQKNNDICSPADIIAGNLVDTTVSGQSPTSVSCSTVENSIALTSLTVDTKRQFTTATIDDIIFEDLRGLNTSNYTITATISNFADPQNANIKIDLGSNPDSVSNETDPDKPQDSNDSNKIFGVLDPSIATITPLRSAATIAFGTDNYIKGSRATVIDNVTQITLLSTSSPTKPGRIALDNVLFKLRIPSLVSAGNFQGTIVQTVI